MFHMEHFCGIMVTVIIADAILGGVVACVLLHTCAIDGCVKMHLQASIFTYGIIILSKMKSYRKERKIWENVFPLPIRKAE